MLTAERTPFVTLIISFYNQRPLAEFTLLSAFEQTLEAPYEVIVCDDGSCDGLLEVVRTISERTLGDLRYMWQPDRGFRLSRSRNNAIRCAQGSIVVFADGDTWLSPGFLKEHADAHRACPALICGMRRTIHGGGREWKPSRQLLHEALHSPGVERQHLRQREALRTNQPWMACVGGNFSAPRSAQLQFDERFEGWGSEDRDLAFRLCKSGLRPRLLPAANAVHIGDPYAGFKSMDSQAVAGFLRSKATLRSKYPGGEMAESLELVRFCRRDAETDVWVISDRRQAESAQEILDEFQRWDARRDSEFGDKSCRLDELAVTAALVSGHRLVREF